VREKKAEIAADIEGEIETELLERLKEGIYGDIYNVNKKVFDKVIDEQELEQVSVIAMAIIFRKKKSSSPTPICRRSSMTRTRLMTTTRKMRTVPTSLKPRRTTRGPSRTLGKVHSLYLSLCQASKRRAQGRRGSD